MGREEVFEKIKKALSFSCYINISPKLKEYDVQYYDGLVGHRNKKFYLVDVGVVTSLIESLLLDENCSYVTHINDDIKNNILPKYISGMIKNIDDDVRSGNKYADSKIIYSEVLGSQILNYFGCSTAYNKAVLMKDNNELSRYRVLSIDFVKYGDEFVTFEDLACDFNGAIIDDIRQIKYELEGSMFDKYSEEEKEKVLEDYVYSYLIRRYVLNDVDFCHTNNGLLVGDSIRHINFDYEFCLSVDKMKEFPLREDLIYCRNGYKDVYYMFIDKIVDLYDALYNLDLDQIITSERHAECLNVLKERLTFIFEVVYKVDRKYSSRS